MVLAEDERGWGALCRAATAIHDDLWAVACVMDDGHTRLGIAVLDAIGFFNDDVAAVRHRLAAEWKLDYTVVCSTHNHSTPDLMGLWGPDFFHTGVDSRYRQAVIAAAVQALGDAVSALQPARVAFHEIPTPPDGLVTDTRKPTVFDADIRLMHFTNPTNGFPGLSAGSPGKRCRNERHPGDAGRQWHPSICQRRRGRPDEHHPVGDRS